MTIPHTTSPQGNRVPFPYNLAIEKPKFKIYFSVSLLLRFVIQQGHGCWYKENAAVPIPSQQVVSAANTASAPIVPGMHSLFTPTVQPNLIWNRIPMNQFLYLPPWLFLWLHNGVGCSASRLEAIPYSALAATKKNWVRYKRQFTCLRNAVMKQGFSFMIIQLKINSAPRRVKHVNKHFQECMDQYRFHRNLLLQRTEGQLGRYWTEAARIVHSRKIWSLAMGTISLSST